MGSVFSTSRFSARFRPAKDRSLHRAVLTPLVVSAALALSACGGGGIESLLGGGDTTAPTGPVAASTTITPVGGSTFAGVSVDQLRADQLCPTLLVRDGTETLRLYNEHMDRSPASVRYQAQILQTAVECTPRNGQFALSIGIAGRVLIGPEGSPASLDMPIRVVVMDRVNNSVISSEIVRATAVIEPPEVSATFTIVNRSYFVPVPGRQSDYQILVGFDEAAG